MRIRVKEFVICAIIFIGCKAIPNNEQNVAVEYEDDYAGVTEQSSRLCPDMQTQLAECEEELYDALRESFQSKELAEQCVHKKNKVKAR